MNRYDERDLARLSENHVHRYNPGAPTRVGNLVLAFLSRDSVILRAALRVTI